MDIFKYDFSKAIQPPKLKFLENPNTTALHEILKEQRQIIENQEKRLKQAEKHSKESTCLATTAILISVVSLAIAVLTYVKPLG